MTRPNYIFRILCKTIEESFDNVFINSEGSSEDISVSAQDEWDDGDTDESTDNQRNILTIQHLIDDKTIVIDKNDVVT